MSGKKHIFKMVPGKKLLNATKLKILDQVDNNELPEDQVDSKGLTWNKLAKVGFIPLDDESDIALDLPIKFCDSTGNERLVHCVEEGKKDLAAKNYYCDNNQDLLTNCRIYNWKGSRNIELDYVNNPHSFAYINDQLMKLSVTKQAIETPSFKGEVNRIFLDIQPVEYQYVTWEESDTDKYYFSDDQGNIIDSLDNEALQYIKLYSREQTIKDIISSNIPEDITLSNTFTKVLVEGLTNGQLQVLAENLTDDQFRALVDHLTNHQLQTLAQELNPEKLQIIVPILNDAQLEALVRDLNPEQVKEILPHLKVDQFKALINNIDDHQLVELAKDLDEHHLTILSKELWHERLPILVHNLEGDRLHDLINKLDHEKLAIVARDLTDTNKIQMIIESLANNPEKLQAFAHSMSHEQFKELLDNVDAKDLKDIIHKLPHEKVISVIGDLGSKDQSNAIIDVLKEKLNEQNEKMKELLDKVDRMIPEESEAIWNDAHPSTYVFQDMNTEFAIIDNLL